MENYETTLPQQEMIKRPKILLLIMAYQTLIAVIPLGALVYLAFIGELGSLFEDINMMNFAINLFVILLSLWGIFLMWKLHVNALYISLGLFALKIYSFMLIELAICIYLFNLRNARILLSTKEKEHLLPESD